MSGEAKTRILGALRELTLLPASRPVSVRDVVARAGVARSTFYANFESKDDALRAILAPVLIPLAESCTGTHDVRRLTAILTHASETAAARAMTVDPSAAFVAEALADLIEARLDAMCRRAQRGSRFPLSSVAAWLAQAQIGVIAEWLSADRRMPPEHVATLISTAARSCVDALVI